MYIYIPSDMGPDGNSEVTNFAITNELFFTYNKIATYTPIVIFSLYTNTGSGCISKNLTLRILAVTF